MALDLSKITKVYFIGIKGVAMSGLAVICKQRGMAVAGSDVAEKFITDKILAKENILVFEGFNPSNLNWGPDLVVIGASWKDDHPEVQETKKRGILHVTDSDLRGLLSKEKETIAVTGVHGKTTTTALLSFLLEKANLKPSFLIGTGSVPDLGSNACWATGRHFIVEGDEYIKSQTERIPKFLDLSPKVTIITSIEWEHVDVFPDLLSLENSFSKLIENTSELVIACGDWESVRKIIQNKKTKVVTYGLDKKNLWQAYDIRQDFSGTTFKVRRDTTELGDFTLKLFGQHNVLNSLACIIACLNAGVDLEIIRNNLKDFSGTERRFEVLEKNNIIFVDDYAHHPTAVKTTLEAIRQRYPKNKIWCIFQPHMVSRTKAFLTDFAQSFSVVDKVIFADIFASAREQVKDITSKELAEEAKKYHPDVLYGGDLNKIIDYLKIETSKQKNLVLVTMGAGDVYRVRDWLI